jgi:hypothetical protein
VDPDTRIDDSSLWIRVRIRILKIKLRVKISYLFGVADPGWVKSQDPDIGSGMKLDPESGKQPGSATLRKP